MTEDELFERIVHDSGLPGRRPQPPFDGGGLPVHPTEPFDYGDERVRIYTEVLGEPTRVHHTAIGVPHIDIEIFEPSSERGFWCYVTNGMSDFPQLILPDQPFRTEFLVCTRSEQPRLPEYLSYLGEFPFRQSCYITVEHTVPMSPGILPSDHNFIVVTPCFLVPPLQQFELNGQPVFMLSATAISAQERAFAMQHSPEALINSLPDTLDSWLLDGRADS